MSVYVRSSITTTYCTHHHNPPTSRDCWLHEDHKLTVRDLPVTSITREKRENCSEKKISETELRPYKARTACSSLESNTKAHV